MNIQRILTLWIALLLVAVPVTAWSFDDEMVFDDDDFDWDEIDEDEDMVFDDGAFDEDPVEETALDVGVVTVPGGALSDAQREELQRVVLEAVRNVPNINVSGDRDLLPALIDREADYCSREPLCLAGVGRAGGVQRLVQARVERTDDGLRLDMDYFDVRDRIFVSYFSRSGLSNMNAVHEAVQPGVNELFGIRTRRPGDEGFEEPDINVTTVMAFTTAGLSGLALASGIFFGIRFNGIQDELDEFSRDDDGRYVDLTQVEARRYQRDLEGTATTANISYVLAGVLAATSVTLFVLDSRGDDTEVAQDDEQPWFRRVELSPQIDRDGAGVGARLRF